MLVGLVPLLIAVPHLPPGACMGDSGDIQAAGATLGIARPPGYVGITAPAWLLCRLLFFVEPAFAVSVFCMLCMAAALVLIALLLMHTGVPGYFAAAMACALLLWPTMWRSLTVPQVYAPSLALLAAAVYVLVRYGECRQAKWLYASGLCLGWLIASRAMASLYLPGFAAALWLIHRKTPASSLGHPAAGAGQGSGAVCAGRSPSPIGPAMLRAAGAVAVPIVVVVAATAMLDRGDRPYNYVRNHAEVHGQPAGPSGGAERMTWLLTGRQFRYQMGATWPQMRAKFRWIRAQFELRETVRGLVVALLLALGAYGLLRRNAPLALVVLSAGLGGVCYLLIYRVQSQSADLLPVIFAGSLLLGVPAARLIQRAGRYASAIGLLLLIAVAARVYLHAGARYSWSRESDVSPFLSQLDVATLPDHTLVVSDWGYAPALQYEVAVRHAREGVRVVMCESDLWPRMIERAPEGWNVVFAGAWTPPAPYRVEPYRNVWRLVR